MARTRLPFVERLRFGHPEVRVCEFARRRPLPWKPGRKRQ